MSCKQLSQIRAALTYNLKVALAGAHWIGVHLTHVPASIVLLHLLDVQVPGSMIIVGEADSIVLRDDIVMNRENCLRIHAHPSHLQLLQQFDNNSSITINQLSTDN